MLLAPVPNNACEELPGTRRRRGVTAGREGVVSMDAVMVAAEQRL